jgi:hypothetical protein
MRFLDMNDEELRTAYIAWRNQMFSWTQLAAPRRADRGRSADGTGRCLRNVEIIEAIARRRGVRL